MAVGWRALALITLLAGACKPYTPRPYFPPVTGAAKGEVQLGVKATTEALADVLRLDTLPILRVEARDGYIETDWFDAGTKQPAKPTRPGPGIVRVRAWIDPSRERHSVMTVETVYRPSVDPSVDPRDLERQVPADHPIAARIAVVVQELGKLYEPASGP